MTEEIFGKDYTKGKKYTEMQQVYADLPQWYNHSSEYWTKQDASINGMLGGFETVHPSDVIESKQFIMKLFPNKLLTSVCDGGAGIGRISENVLLPFLDISKPCHMDLVDVHLKFLQQAQAGVLSKRPTNLSISLHANGLQNYQPSQKCDLFWIQWVIIYLTDQDLISLLQRCAANLKDANSYICIKENICRKDNEFVVDSDDCSVMRGDLLMRGIFEKAGLQLVTYEDQKNFPQELYPVRMYALRPKH